MRENLKNVNSIFNNLSLQDKLSNLVDQCVASLDDGGKIILFGNGGSAADSQHIAAELVGKLQHPRDALAALSLTTDTSAITAIANDYGYNKIFSRQIEALGKPGDIAIGLSTSGNSANVLEGLTAAHDQGLKTWLWTGNNDKPADHHLMIKVPGTSPSRIQEMHIMLGHILVAEIEEKMQWLK